MKPQFWKAVFLILFCAFILWFITGCATTKEVSCYKSEGKPVYHGEVRQIDRHHFIDGSGNLITQNGLCVHDNPGFFNRATGGIFDSLERGQ